MAKRKRGLATAIAKVSKSRRIAKVRTAPSQIDYDREYKIRQILREDHSHYLIDWEDDEETGEAYKPTWEPKANANQLAVDDWQRQKSRQQQPSASSPEKGSGDIGNSPRDSEVPTSSDSICRPGRPHNIRTRPALLASSSSPIDNLPSEIDESPRITTQALLDTPTINLVDHKEVTVIIGDPPSSFAAAEYYPAPESAAQDSSQLTGSTSHSGELLPSSPQRESGTGGSFQSTAAQICIPDSQTVAEDIDPTQEQSQVRSAETFDTSIVDTRQVRRSLPPVSARIDHISSQHPNSSPLPSLPSHPIQQLHSISQRPTTPTTPSGLSSSAPSSVENPFRRTSPLTSHEGQAVQRRYLKVDLLSYSDEISSVFRAIDTRIEQAAIDSDYSSASPSTIAAMEPVPTISQEEMNTSARFETLLPESNENSVQTQQITGLVENAEPLRENIHIIPIPLLGHQRDQYPYTMWYHRDLIERYLAATELDASLISTAEDFLQRMHSLVIHPDLDNPETLTQFDVHPSQQAQWDIDCSTKFRFLKSLFDRLKGNNVRLVVLVSSQGLLNKISLFFQGIDVAVMPLASGSGSDIPTVTIVEADDLSDALGSQLPNAVIAIDRVIQRKDIVSMLPETSEAMRNSIPWISLVVPNTVEHIEHSLSPSIPHPMRLKAILNGAYRLRKEAGKLNDLQWDLERTAETLAGMLCADSRTVDWPVPALDMLVDIDSETQSETIDKSDPSTKRRYDDDTGPIEDSDDEMSRKRARAVNSTAGDPSTLTVNPQDVEITHISDSVARTTQPDQSQSSDNIYEQLKQLQEKVIEYEESLSGLQYQFEEQREELIKATIARDAANESARLAITRLTDQASLLSSLRTERAALKDKLEEAQISLGKHEVPERAEFEALRISADAAKAERDHANARMETVRKDLEYAQTMYQQSSTSAQALAAENKELEAQLQDARRRADGRQVELRQMGHDARVELLRRDLRRSRILLQTREQALKFREEEIARTKEASRGRMGTRGGSIPRSPRLGSPLKFGSRSRQGSPSASEIKSKGSVAAAGHLHPLRNS